jgi:glutamyl-tRNA reductase
VQIVITGVNHGTAPLGVRERLAVSRDELRGVLRELHGTVGECFVLSTCNRVELYAVTGHESTGGEILRRWFAARGGLTAPEIAACSYTHGHEAAALHAFRVATGLDSLIVGEDQILGQLRRAIADAREAGSLGPVLDRLGTSALACGKRVRTATEMGQASPSVVSVALAQAMRVRGSLEGARILLIGSGETAGLALRHLLAASPGRITVAGRTAERTAALALAHGVDAADLDALPSLIASADVVVGCTAAPAPVLTAGMLRASRQAASPPLLCIDLGVPRDFEPGVRDLPGVTLIDIDSIGVAASELRLERHRQIAAAEELVSDEVERFMAWWRERDVAPAIARLHAHAQRIRTSELERALSRLPSLTPHEQDVVRALAERITSKLLHDPTIELKRDPEGANMAMMLDRLFRLTPADERALSRDAGAPSGVAESLHPHHETGDHS